jgi:hypothetical protein
MSESSDTPWEPSDESHLVDVMAKKGAEQKKKVEPVPIMSMSETQSFRAAFEKEAYGII